MLSCEHKTREVNIDRLAFDTNDATVLFFKNVRRAYYTMEDRQDAKAHIFRLQDWEDLDQPTHLQTAIIHQWTLGKAYVFLESKHGIDVSKPFQVNWQKAQTNEQGILEYTVGNAQEQAIFLTKLYQLLQQEASLTVDIDQKKEPLFGSKDGQDLFRKTMIDYYRLIQML
ncbi:hypothetical protein PEPS_27020 [Persicobacter psychrovividus]|uniref:Uncharacterized protein n=2 Tax=Persicobacter psychrovividus TaxID=387638 RepID=A0ABN6LG11_9BACT|nr:hypothetical protein PEPS_27020 [Persicobacter psychrovividus]